jgi:two-component system, LytTR family, response regulator
MTEKGDLKILIIEDEKGPRELLKLKLIKLAVDAKNIFEAKNIDEAVSILEQKCIQVIFLDMNLSGVDGLTLYDYIDNEKTAVIFSTAYPDYAIKAIQKKAAGYILKPFNDEEIKIALENALEIIKMQSTKVLYAELLDKILEENNDHSIAVLHGNKKEIIKYKDITYFQGADKYTYIFTTSGAKYLSSTNLGRYKETLENHGFIDCHKSFLVNKKYIKSYSLDHIHLECGVMIPISRRKKSNLTQNL